MRCATLFPCISINEPILAPGLTLVFRHYRARTYISTFWVVIGRCHSSADAGTLSSHFWKKINDNARSNPGSSIIFLIISRTIFVVFYYYMTFFIMLFEHTRISLNIIYSIINSCHITYLHFWCFCVLTGVEPGPFILLRQHSTPRLQGACKGGILESPTR